MNVSVQQLNVSTKLDENEKASIDQVSVVLGESKETNKASAASEPSEKPFIAAMKPISPIILDLKPEGDKSFKQVESTKVKPPDPLQEQVKQYIAHEWQIKPIQIQVN
jgi:hypothetical protein